MALTGWNSLQEIQRDIQVFDKLCLVFLGLYGWEFLTSLSADYEILFKQRKFRPAQLLYLACRYSILGFLIGVNIAMEATEVINCVAIYRFNNLALGCTLGTASLLLMMRSLVVWAYDKRIMIPLLVLCLGHWVIIFRDIVGTHASWNVMAGTCAVDAMFRYWMAIEFIYTMVLDFVILCVTVVGVMVRLPMKSNVRDLILHDGLMYFLCAFFANLIPSVLMLSHLNPVMDFMATPIAATITAIAATRCARRLAGLATSPPPSRNSKPSSSWQTPSVPPSYNSRTKDKDGYLSPDASFLSLNDDSIPARPTKARLSHGRSEKADLKQDIKVSDDHFQPQSPSRTLVHFDQSSKTDVHTQDGSQSSRKSSLVSSLVGDSQVSLPNAQAGGTVDYYRFHRTPIPNSVAPSGLDSAQLEHSNDTSAIGFPTDQKPLHKIDPSSDSMV